MPEQPEHHVYTASRLSPGNILFRDKLILEPERVVFKKAKLIGGDEETIPYEQIASVSIQRGMFFADLLFETTGGSEPIFLNGLWRRTATRAKMELDAKIRVRSVNKEQKMMELLEEQTELLRQILTQLKQPA